MPCHTDKIREIIAEASRVIDGGLFRCPMMLHSFILSYFIWSADAFFLLHLLTHADYFVLFFYLFSLYLLLRCPIHMILQATDELSAAGSSLEGGKHSRGNLRRPPSHRGQDSRAARRMMCAQHDSTVAMSTTPPPPLNTYTHGPIPKTLSLRNGHVSDSN